MHKEKYFSRKTIQKKAGELLMYVSASRGRRAGIAYHPEKAALLVLDMQEYFLKAESHAFVPSAPAIIPGINKLIEVFEARDRPVFATRHVNTIENAGMMSNWWRDLIDQRSAHSQLFDGLERDNSILIEKSQYDAFFNTNLDEQLHSLNAEQVVITGVMTHLCCESTARSAFMRGYEVFFTIDGTATYNEELHRASLLTLSHGFAIPVLVGELIEQMELHAS